MQAFYTAFRSEMTQQLGLSDEQLSFYSPMTPKRPIDMANAKPLSAWTQAREVPTAAAAQQEHDNEG